MSIIDVFDGIAPGEYERALAWMQVIAAGDEGAAPPLDDVAELVTALTKEA
jgi:hypothetical protein